MVGTTESVGWWARVTSKLSAAALLFGVALSGWSCSSDAPAQAPKGDGDVPPPLSQPCDSDLDCDPFGLKCDPLHGCLPCVFDWHCKTGERCTAEGCQVPAKCSSDAECSATSKVPHCDPVLGECVGCRFESDCPMDAHCIERSCSSYKACVNTRDCAEGTVCNRDAGECVECLGNGDCEAGKEVCVATHCVPVCTSDKDCIHRNQLCHHEKGYCADCVEQVDCPDVYYCDQDLCKLDVCKVGTTTCMGGTSIGTCNAIGSGYDIAACPISTTCAEKDGIAACQPWLCTPGTSDCDVAGNVLKLCAQDGLSIASEQDCAADGQSCYLQQCKPKVCEPGSLFCQGNEARECTANGTDSVLRSTCGQGQYCVEGQATCAVQNCAPDLAYCDGEVATKCDSIGSGLLPDGTDCTEDGNVCYAGACAPVVCDGPFCQDGNAWSCLNHGTLSALSATCNSNQYCADGGCHYDQCTADEPLCDDNIATTCKADGSGIKAGGTDCSLTDQACENGACVPIVCDPNTYYCLGGNPQLCNELGTGSAYQTGTCSASYFCKPGQSYCAYDLCVAGAKMCDQNVATTCAADGSGPVAGGTNCTASNKVCDSGTCLPKVCEPNTYFCQGGNSYSCGTSGATSTLLDTCSAGEFCKEGTPYCQYDLCTAGTPTCNGDKLSTCAVDGSGPVDAGTACGASKICQASACKDVICTLDALTCTTDNVYKCIDKGTAWQLWSNCGGTTYCNDLADPITCSDDTCAPAANACNGEKLATCAADGGHYSATTTDCSATNKVCTLTGACAAVAEDTVGDITTSTTLSSYLVGNIYRVDRARTLTEIEQYLSVAGTSVFTWVVYEGDYYSTTFTKVFESTTSSSGTAVFHSSGAISVPLAAGKFYFFGVIVQGSFTRFYLNSNVKPFVSFGQLYNSYFASMTTAPASQYMGTSNFRYNQRISTAEVP